MPQYTILGRGLCWHFTTKRLLNPPLYSINLFVIHLVSTCECVCIRVMCTIIDIICHHVMWQTYLANLKRCCKSQYYYCEGNNYNDYNYMLFYIMSIHNLQFSPFSVSHITTFFFLSLFDVRSRVFDEGTRSSRHFAKSALHHLM